MHKIITSPDVYQRPSILLLCFIFDNESLISQTAEKICRIKTLQLYILL